MSLVLRTRTIAIHGSTGDRRTHLHGSGQQAAQEGALRLRPLCVGGSLRKCHEDPVCALEIHLGCWATQNEDVLQSTVSWLCCLHGRHSRATAVQQHQIIAVVPDIDSAHLNEV